MAIRIPRLTVTLMDFEGETATVSVWFKLDDTAVSIPDMMSDAAGYAASIAEISNAVLVGFNVGLEDFQSKTPPSKVGNYSSVEDKALLIFTAENGLPVRLSIPAPQDSIFKSDGETVNPAGSGMNGLIANWKTEASGGTQVTTNEGTTLNDYQRGYRKRSKSRSERPGWSPAIG